MAKYYENLYSFDKDLKNHPHHKYVTEKITEYENNYEHESLWYGRPPSKKEIGNVIQSKKNRKATTDFPNELLKRGGDGFLSCIHAIIKYFWMNEVPPDTWNEGLITNVWKGKGDREQLKYQRGITVSSTISMICEQIINERMTELVPLTQAQGGGKKGCSTRDHVFLLRGAISHAIKNRIPMYVTYYDVAKAYDRADVEDMLVIAWEHGLKGKLWRLMKNLNTNLTAKIKTRHGLTRKIKRNAGGKQGGKNFGYLFAKMMDVLAEEAHENEKLGVCFNDQKISVLEWVDDVITFAIGEQQQNDTLTFINEFAVKHKLKWGNEKCNVMEISTKSYKRQSWKLGEQMIDSCETYRYLGDIIMKNGGNKKNIEERENKTMAVTRKILSLCSDEVFRAIQLKSLLKMHNACTVASLLTNCETWILNKSEKTKLERIELWALKRILDVPKTTPSAAIWHVTGLLPTSVLVEKRQLLYLKKILDKQNDDWLKQMFYCLKNDDIGWAKQILSTLNEYGLNESLEEIQHLTNAAWKRKVNEATEKKNKEKLIDMCVSRDGEKSKTKKLLYKIQKDEYKRVPCMDILNKSRHLCRAQIMTMYGMLDCAKNFKTGYKREICSVCKVLDDESHRINYCSKYQNINLFHSPIKIDFESIHSGNKKAIKRVLEVVGEIWDLTNGKNLMRPS